MMTLLALSLSDQQMAYELSQILSPAVNIVVGVVFYALGYLPGTVR